jgi:salicylate hydroxylase
MKIIIVGGGLGGLTAAYCFAQNGHDVTLFERRDGLPPQGSAIAIGPAAARILHSWGLKADLERHGQATWSTLLRDLGTGDIAMRHIPVEASDHKEWATSRLKVAQMLYPRALGAGADIRYRCTVVDVHDDHRGASVTLEDGSVLRADMVLAADGVGSRLRAKILADVNAPKDLTVESATMYSVAVPGSEVRAMPGTAKLMDQHCVNAWMGAGLFVVSRYDPEADLVEALYGIADDETPDMKTLWEAEGDLAHVERAFAPACSDLRGLLRAAKGCDRWKLTEIPNLPRWSSKEGRVLLLGDSAHGMHPNAAQGYSQVVEDVGVLDYLVQQQPDPERYVPRIAQTWEALRKPRAEKIKSYAKLNTMMFTGLLPIPLLPEGYKPVQKSLRNTVADRNAKPFSSAFLKWVLNHDPVEEVGLSQASCSENEHKLTKVSL